MPSADQLQQRQTLASKLLQTLALKSLFLPFWTLPRHKVLLMDSFCHGMKVKSKYVIVFYNFENELPQYDLQSNQSTIKG